MDWSAKWIRPIKDMGDVCPVFSVDFSCLQNVKNAMLKVTATGVYEAVLNGRRVGGFILAPGWTVYEKRLQVQEYDVTDMIDLDNVLEITVGKGWYRSPLAAGHGKKRMERVAGYSAGLTAELVLTMKDGVVKTISTDENWKVAESQVRFSEIYDGEIYDATFKTTESNPVCRANGNTDFSAGRGSL